ncbi:MAG: hypothetical protein Tp182DCM212571_91 [Prokaryotic dsDNA virus sp.]|jgi:hypothetical protein|nr:MAG: hypothetical protein Tp182DCM212571_91 [Prokaryotic dsDNA virus sp.]|tara:strand:+ start:71 stop:367 length:297 start_codon:yes stop_codon:yes gene_type:complete
MNYWNRTDTWTTRDGTVLDLEDIEQDHAENIIAMIYRQAETIRWYEGWNMAIAGYGVNGEAAMDLWDSEMAFIEDSSDEEFIESLPLVRKLRELLRSD